MRNRRLSREQLARMRCYEMVKLFFKNDYEKVDAWYATPNPMLGNVSPNAIIQAGRTEKLARFINDQLAQGGMIS